MIATGLAFYGFQSDFVKKNTRKRKIFHDEERNAGHFHENEEKEFEVNLINTAQDTLIQQISDRHQAAEKMTNMFSFLWFSKSNSRSNEEEIKAHSLEEKCVYLCERYVIEEKLIEEVRHLDILKRANLFSPKESLTSMKLLNGMYQKWSSVSLLISKHFATHFQHDSRFSC